MKVVPCHTCQSSSCVSWSCEPFSPLRYIMDPSSGLCGMTGVSLSHFDSSSIAISLAFLPCFGAGLLAERTNLLGRGGTTGAEADGLLVLLGLFLDGDDEEREVMRPEGEGVAFLASREDSEEEDEDEESFVFRSLEGLFEREVVLAVLGGAIEGIGLALL